MTEYETYELDTVIETAISALESGGLPGYPVIDGRVIAVLATPDKGTSSDMAIGVSALPPNYSTAEHAHRAEEIANVVYGSGTITIEDEPIPVRTGSIVVAPPHARHITTSSQDKALVVLWTYAPAGSEARWLESDAVSPSTT